MSDSIHINPDRTVTRTKEDGTEKTTPPPSAPTHAIQWGQKRTIPLVPEDVIKPRFDEHLNIIRGNVKFLTNQVAGERMTAVMTGQALLVIVSALEMLQDRIEAVEKQEGRGDGK